MSNIENVAAKIRALLNMTQENGASENEAIIAMSKARQLIDARNLTMDEVALKAEGTDDFFWSDATAFQTRILRSTGLWEAIEQLTETKYWNHSAKNNKRRRTFRPRYFGFTGDVMFAQWLCKTLIDTIERATDAFISSSKDKSSRNCISFAYGMGERISDRIWEEVHARQAGRKIATGTSLVVINKKALVEDEFKNKIGLRLTSTAASSFIMNGTSVSAGADAGNGVNWSRPINNGNDVLALKG